jgi:hypothetical protein
VFEDAGFCARGDERWPARIRSHQELFVGAACRKEQRPDPLYGQLPLPEVPRKQHNLHRVMLVGLLFCIGYAIRRARKCNPRRMRS